MRSYTQSPRREIERKKKRINASSGCEGMLKNRDTRCGSDRSDILNDSDPADVELGESCQRANTTGACKLLVRLRTRRSTIRNDHYQVDKLERNSPKTKALQASFGLALFFRSSFKQRCGRFLRLSPILSSKSTLILGF